MTCCECTSEDNGAQADSEVTDGVDGALQDADVVRRSIPAHL